MTDKGQQAVATVTSALELTAREAMIDSQLKPCGVIDPAVVAAFHAVPRELFVPTSRRRLAYVDAAQPLAAGRQMMAPLSLGYLLQAARPRAGDRVLLVGAATGYSAALLARLAGHVVALECEPELVAAARSNLMQIDGVEIVEGPLEAGWPAGAPYTLILIDGAIEEVARPLVAQLAEGGRLVAIVHGSDGVSRAAIGRKQAGQLQLVPFAEAPAAVLPPFRKAPAFRF